MDRQFLANGNAETQGFAKPVTPSSARELANPCWPSLNSGKCGGECRVPPITGMLGTLGLGEDSGMVCRFAGMARTLNGFLAEGKGGVHGNSQVTPRGVTVFVSPT